MIAEARLLAQHDVRGLDVAVDDAVLVRVREARQDLADELHRARDRHRPLPDQLLEILARHEIHHDERAVRMDPDVEHGGAVRVLELGHRTRLDLESLAARQLVR